MGLFTMPILGADMDQGTIVEWRVQPGDVVERGQIVAVVETDKAAIDVEVFESGIVEALLVDAGSTVPVGTPLARISAPEPAGATSTPSPVAPEAEPHDPRVSSPLVRRRAHQLGVDLDHLTGSGPGGRITRDDVERAAPSGPAPQPVQPTAPAPPAPPTPPGPPASVPSPAPTPDRVTSERPDRRQRATPRARRLAAERSVDLSAVRGSGARGTISTRDLPTDDTGSPAAPEPVTRSGPRAAAARSMERSQREIPHFHLWDTVDLEPALALLERINRDRPPADRVLPAAVLLASVAAAAREVPEVNGWWANGDLVASDTVDLGTVVSLRTGGLATPTIQRADELTVDELMVRLKELVERSRRGGLRTSDMTNASLTVTNLGDRGAEVVHGMIQPPQVALVGFGRIAVRPFVVDDRVEPRHTVVVSLAADHRASDGRIGSRFLHLVRRQLVEPDRLPFGPTSPDPSRRTTT